MTNNDIERLKTIVEISQKTQEKILRMIEKVTDKYAEVAIKNAHLDGDVLALKQECENSKDDIKDLQTIQIINREKIAVLNTKWTDRAVTLGAGITAANYKQIADFFVWVMDKFPSG